MKKVEDQLKIWEQSDFRVKDIRLLKDEISQPYKILL